MDFSLTEEQLIFKEQVLKFARKEIVLGCKSTTSRLNLIGNRGSGWGSSEFSECTFLRSSGGSGADVVTSVLAAEALGEAGVDGDLP